MVCGWDETSPNPNPMCKNGSDTLESRDDLNGMTRQRMGIATEAFRAHCVSARLPPAPGSNAWASGHLPPREADEGGAEHPDGMRRAPAHRREGKNPQRYREDGLSAAGEECAMATRRCLSHRNYFTREVAHSTGSSRGAPTCHNAVLLHNRARMQPTHVALALARSSGIGFGNAHGHAAPYEE